MFQTHWKYSKHVANVSNWLRIFKTRFKCFKRVVLQNFWHFESLILDQWENRNMWHISKTADRRAKLMKIWD